MEKLSFFKLFVIKLIVLIKIIKGDIKNIYNIDNIKRKFKIAPKSESIVYNEIFYLLERLGMDTLDKKISEDDFINICREKGVDNIRFLVFMDEIISFYPICITDSNKKFLMKCKIIQDGRYDVMERFKLSITTSDFVYYITHFYLSDFVNLINQGSVIILP